MDCGGIRYIDKKMKVHVASSQGNVGTCSCAQNTNTTPQSLDLGLYQASFVNVPSGLSFSGVNIKAKATSVTPTTIYP